MRLHYFQHEPFEGLGTIAEWAAGKGFTLSATHFYKGDAIDVQPQEIDLLVVMGGSMNADEESVYPWMAAEKEFIRAMLDAGKYVLGICLGAQLIARVLGAPVTRNPHKEIGWLPIRFTDAALKLPLFAGMDREMTVFHWHGDTFALPQGAVALASSDACTHQGYLWQGRALGLQFHMEITEAQVQDFAHHGDAEIEAGGPYVQSAAALLAGAPHAAAMCPALRRMLDGWLEKAPFFNR